MSHGSLDSRAWHTPCSRRPRPDDFPMLGSAGIFRTFLVVPPRQPGGTYWDAGRAPYRGASLYTGANQTPGDLRRPAGDRYRERAVIQRTQGVVRAADCHKEILGVIASSPTNFQPVLDAVAERAARVCELDDQLIRLVEGNAMSWQRTSERFHGAGRSTYD